MLLIQHLVRYGVSATMLSQRGIFIGFTFGNGGSSARSRASGSCEPRKFVTLLHYRDHAVKASAILNLIFNSPHDGVLTQFLLAFCSVFVLTLRFAPRSLRSRSSSRCGSIHQTIRSLGCVVSRHGKNGCARPERIDDALQTWNTSGEDG
jgi:hypothetical protein